MKTVIAKVAFLIRVKVNDDGILSIRINLPVLKEMLLGFAFWILMLAGVVAMLLNQELIIELMAGIAAAYFAHKYESSDDGGDESECETDSDCCD